jgi:hypothetical protein
MPAPRKRRRNKSPGDPGALRARIWLAGGLLLLVLIASAALIFWKRDRPGSAAAVPRSRPAPQAAGLADERQVFATYGGSASCKDCHEEAFELWQKSNHGLAERPWNAAMDGMAFQPGRMFAHGSQQTTVGMSNGQPQVTTTGPIGQREPTFQIRTLPEAGFA